MIALKFTFVVSICLLFFLFVSAAFGCMYTVRDVGFVDIDSNPYRLYCYIRDDTPKEFTSTFKQISYAALIESNIEVEIINVDQPNNSRAYDVLDSLPNRIQNKREYLDFWEIKSFPATILVSPGGRSLVLPISKKQARTPALAENESFKETLWTVLESVVSSPKREEILEHIIKSYCVVLLIHSKPQAQTLALAAENKRVKQSITDAIEKITKDIRQMPKQIKEPPRLISVSPEFFSKEKVLLWSLGITENEIDEPRVAVLYGRGRQIGPLLVGKSITESRIYDILSTIGLSCECGLDRKWMLGSMLPIRWREKLQSEAVRLLGFDPESPMVKTEISQILSQGRTEGTAKSAVSPREHLYGYREDVVEFEKKPVVATVPPSQFRQPTTIKKNRVSPRNSVSSSVDLLHVTLFAVGGVALLILVGSMLIILRARRRLS